MPDPLVSKTIRAGSRTYFLDIKQSEKGKKYLLITESRFKGDGKERERSSLFVFPEDATAFLEAIREMVGRLHFQKE